MSVHDTKISDFTNVLKAFYAKLVSIIPTKTSQLENDSGYKTTDNTLTNNLLATVPGTALDAVQGKVLDDKIEEVSASLADLLTLDYDNAVKLTPNASFTPNSNGYVIVFARSTGTYGNVGLISGNSYASISNHSEKWLCISQQINGYNLGLNMIVKKGQPYYFHSESVTLFSARFVPFK